MSELARWCLCFRRRHRDLASWVVALLVLGVGSRSTAARSAKTSAWRNRSPSERSTCSSSGSPRSPATRSHSSSRRGHRRRPGRAPSDGGVLRWRVRPGRRGGGGLPLRRTAPVSADRTTAMARVRLAEFGPEVDPELVRSEIDRAERLSDVPRLQADVGGPTAMFAELEPPGGAGSWRCGRRARRAARDFRVRCWPPGCPWAWPSAAWASRSC